MDSPIADTQHEEDLPIADTQHEEDSLFADTQHDEGALIAFTPQKDAPTANTQFVHVQLLQTKGEERSHASQVRAEWSANSTNSA